MINKLQKDHILKALLQLGFTGHEALVYLAILEEGSSSIPSISRMSELSRGTVYDLVEKLKKRGYVAETKGGKKRRIIPESPTNQLYLLLSAKKDEYEKTTRVVEKILPVLKGIRPDDDFVPKIRIYAGRIGFDIVWNDIFSYEGKKFLSIARMETFVKFVGEDYLTEIQERKAKLGFSSRAIHEDSPFARQLLLVDKKYNRETKIAPKEFEFPSTEIIYGDKIAMFSTREENIILVIESRDFAQTHRAYFEMLWKFLEKNQ